MTRLKTLADRVSVKPDQLKTLKPDSWRATKQTAAQRGYGYKWQQARLAFLGKHPLCAYCERQGLVTAANIVDHIVPHRGDMTLFWDRANWQSMCQPCHDQVKKAEEAAGLAC